jgi:hypothetical protein
MNLNKKSLSKICLADVGRGHLNNSINRKNFKNSFSDESGQAFY